MTTSKSRGDERTRPTVTRAPEPPTPLSGSGSTTTRTTDEPPSPRSPDWSPPPEKNFWIHEDEWALHDAALLLLNLEPRKGLGLHLKRLIGDDCYDGSGFIRVDHTPASLNDDERALFERAHEIVRRALVAYRKGSLSVAFPQFTGQRGTVEPRPFLLWANGKGYEVPDALKSMVIGVRSRAELEQEAAQLRAELERRNAAWPWGQHTTQLLEHLKAAAEKWWARYDETDATTAPTNDQVTEWLMDERKVSKRVAEIMAQILRADGLRKGPRS